MDGKDCSMGRAGGYDSSRPRKSRRLATVILISLAIISTLHFGGWELPRPSFHTCHERLNPASFTYAGESIKWNACGEIANRTLECSSVDVPMDQFDADNSGDKTFSIPLIRLRGKNATQNLLLNPGGPGGSGLNFLYRRGEQLSTIVGEGFHLLSFDPRGINSSRPSASCYPTAELRRQLSSVRDNKLIEDSAEMYAWSHNLVRACAETMGEHGKYVNTPQTAADMNSILDAVGQEDMAYWGFSYGTILGQTYAGLFPNRSKRVIIDGVANQFDWYEGQLDYEAFTDSENVFNGFRTYLQELSLALSSIIRDIIDERITPNPGL